MLPSLASCSCLHQIQNIYVHKAEHGPAPSYLKAIITPYAAPCSLQASSTAQLVPPDKEGMLLDPFLF